MRNEILKQPMSARRKRKSIFYINKSVDVRKLLSKNTLTNLNIKPLLLYETIINSFGHIMVFSNTLVQRKQRLLPIS